VVGYFGGTGNKGGRPVRTGAWIRLAAAAAGLCVCGCEIDDETFNVVADRIVYPRPKVEVTISGVTWGQTLERRGSVTLTVNAQMVPAYGAKINEWRFDEITIETRSSTLHHARNLGDGPSASASAKVNLAAFNPGALSLTATALIVHKQSGSLGRGDAKQIQVTIVEPREEPKKKPKEECQHSGKG
jgi:hypothetical protein